MSKQTKILLGVLALVAFLFLAFGRRLSGSMIAVPGDAHSQSLPMVAPITPTPSVFNFPGGSYVPQNISSGSCGCAIPGANATSNLLPATAQSFAQLVSNSGVDQSMLQQQEMAAVLATDYTPQTSSLYQMILSGGPSATPF
jgi:hypothetical protein